MEPPVKRPRTGPSPLGQQSKEDEDDELNYEPDDVSRMRDPGYQLEQSRAFAAFKLKSTFEHIFQKYERDFTGIGDEIDLRTGEIITDNGHLARMRNERDTGIPDQDDEEDEGMLLEDAFASGDDDDDDDDDDEDEEEAGDEKDERTLGGEDATPPSTALSQKAEVDLQPRSSLSHALPASRPESEQRLSDLGLTHQPANGKLKSVDPTWRVPEINPPQSDDDLIAKLYGARYRFPVSSGSQSEKAAFEPAQASRMARPTSKKTLQVLQVFTADGDNEDDILGKNEKKKKSGKDVTEDFPAKESGRHKPRKSSLVPAKVRKPRNEEHLADATTRPGSTRGLSDILTGEEMQKRRRRHIITEAEDPEDMDIFDAARQDTVEALKLGDLTVSEPVTKSPVPRGAVAEASTDAAAHEIDPAYAFSDDDDGIPATRARAGRNQKEATAVLVTEESTKQKTLPSQFSGDRQYFETQPEADAENALQATTDVHHVTHEINMAGAEHAQSTEDVDMQILELLDEIYQETEQLEQGQGAIESSDVTLIQEGDETEEEHAAGDILREKDEEVIEPFIVPLGLDEMDETSTTETGPGPEAMDFELPTLAPLAEAPPPTGALSAMPRRGRLSSAIHSGRPENTATSPMRGLVLRSSSPPERHADPDSSPADAGGPRETMPETQDAAASRYSPALPLRAARPDTPDAPGRKRQPKQPSTPSSRRPRITTKGSSARISVISLLSEDEDDRLTPDRFKTRTPGGRDVSSRDPTATPAQQRHRMAAWAFATPSKARRLGSPSGSPARTPGGNLRRCGEEGFRCNRDFCFTCVPVDDG
ncbi:hypothetical protein LX32DRAFT_676560 [Colletotrichum zoysiae]|uniref:Centromere protein Scm3 n=1 Tax=Colletotrichum zoysiae TaxID=1216348 RepID=A0AAD9H8T8_9PEZI|nr:hypothetical protein LX32DRAFT_676560 [Colletotrichum zoysiae]